MYQSFFDSNSRVATRAKLIRVARHAFIMWGQAVDLHAERTSALRPSASCIAESAALVKHRNARYIQLETALASVTGLNEYSVFNDISHAWPIVPRLMTANL